MEIQKGNIILKYDEEKYLKSIKKNSFLMETIRSFLVIIISFIFVIIEIFLFNKLPETFNIVMYITLFLTICLIVGIYARICIFLNRKNPNYYLIHNLMKMEKCKILKFYNRIIILYELNKELHSMSLNYILTNMMSNKTVVKDMSNENISNIYIDTIENIIFINGDNND